MGLELGEAGFRREDFERLHPKLISVFLSRGASLEEARELVQETYVQAWRSRDSFEGRSHLDTWMFTIAKRVWLKEFRRRRTQKRDAVEVSLTSDSGTFDLQDPVPSAEDQASANQLLRQVSASMSSFPVQMREAAVLFFNGHKYREIAERLEVSENQVASLIHQARTKLRREHLR